MVLHAAHVGEAQVDELDLVVLDQLFDVVDGHSGTASLCDVMLVFTQGACQPESALKSLILMAHNRVAPSYRTFMVRS